MDVDSEPANFPIHSAPAEVTASVAPYASAESLIAERERLWRRWVELQPSADAFRRLAGREIPLFVLTRRG